MPARKRKADNDLPFPSKQSIKENSTVRRKNLSSFIHFFGDIMRRACANCRRLSLECKVHPRSGICGACHASGSQKTCDIRITQDEWSRLVSERSRLLEEMKTARQKQQDAEQARIAAEAVRIVAEQNRRSAFDQETSLRESLRRLESEAAAAIELEEAQILALERYEADQAARSAPELALSPYTYSAEAGVSDDFWEPQKTQ